MNNIIEKANKVYLENFKPVTWFERALFFSWYCKIADCKYCYMSTQPNKNKDAVRSIASILAETIICKRFGWRVGFISSGHNAYSTDKILFLLKNINKITGEKLWLNIGVLKEDELKLFSPYVKGVVGAIETVNPQLHEELCPSKPIGPFMKMFKASKRLGLKNAMTIIVGLGETIKDFPLLKEFIIKHNIEKIHIYGLNPQNGTIFEKVKPPSAEYQSEWIAKTRIAFPKIDIQAGIWVDKVENVSALLKAGANSISKFPAIRRFNSKEALGIEEEAKKAGRKFQGSLTRLPKPDFSKELNKIPNDLKRDVDIKLRKYIELMNKNTKR
tara:strand:- start:21863 stop:22849 length:987 start_codon:yes stop_codon:yes gene_type:complete